MTSSNRRRAVDLLQAQIGKEEEKLRQAIQEKRPFKELRVIEESIAGLKKKLREILHQDPDRMLDQISARGQVFSLLLQITGEKTKLREAIRDGRPFHELKIIEKAIIELKKRLREILSHNPNSNQISM